MLPYNYSIKKSNDIFLVPDSWADQIKRPRGVDFKNGIYYIFDAMPQKNTILFSSADIPHLKEIIFYLIQRYSKTYTREYFEQINGQLFNGIRDYLDKKRTSLDGITGMFSGILFGDKQYKFKMTFYVNHSVPLQFSGAKLAVGIAVDRILGPLGNAIKNPQDIANAYKEIRTIFSQELEYVPQDPGAQ